MHRRAHPHREVTPLGEYPPVSTSNISQIYSSRRVPSGEILWRNGHFGLHSNTELAFEAVAQGFGHDAVSPVRPNHYLGTKAVLFCGHVHTQSGYMHRSHMLAFSDLGPGFLCTGHQESIELVTHNH